MAVSGTRRSRDYPPRSASWVRGLSNLLLFVPLIALYPPLYNRTEPRLIGIPFFYWFLLFCILLSAGCTYLAYRLTRDDYVVTDRPDRLSVDALDEGASR